MKTIKEIAYILNRRERAALILLLLGMIVSAGLELVGISVLLPIINLIASPDTAAAVGNSWYLQIVTNLFRIDPADSKRLIITVIVLVMAIYVIKAAYTILLSALQSKFANGFNRKLATSLFRTYLYQPYDFYLYQNSADLLRSATTDVDGFISAIITLLSLLSDVIFCIAIFAYLMILDYIITLIVFFVIGGISVVLLLAVKKKMKAYGAEMRWLNSHAIKEIQESIGGIKETKVSGREEYFLGNYDSIKKGQSDVSFKNTFLASFPRTIIEAVGMISILTALLIYAASGSTNAGIIATFSLFVVAIVKLLPYVSRFNGEINSLRYSMASVNAVYNDLRLINNFQGVKVEKEETVPMPFQDKIEMKGVSFIYKGTDKKVLSGVNCTIEKGQSTAFCGQSGAGKTTTVDIILGLLKPTEGQVLCDGVDISKSLRSWHRDISYIPQDIYLVDDTIRTNIAFGLNPSLVKDEDVWKALDEAQLGDFVRGLPDKLNSSIGEKGVRLSGGQRQRIGIARALFRNTQIIVFDEATSALDFQTEGEILNTVNGLKGTKTLIIITHRLNTISNCDRIYEIKDAAMTLTKGGESNAH